MKRLSQNVASHARALSQRLNTLRELTRLLTQNGRWWLVPFVAVLSLTAVLMIAVAVIEYVAPFVYTIF